MLNVYDTRGRPNREQFDYWRDELCHNFVEMAPERAERGIPAAFEGQISQRQLADVSVSRVTAEEHRVNRTALEIGRSSEACFFANLQLAGPGLTRQGATEMITKPGDLVLINAAEPFEVRHDEPFDMISVKVPHTLLADRLELKRRPLIPHIVAERGYGTILRSYTNAILYELHSEFCESAPFLAENLVSLIASALNAAPGSTASAGMGQQQYSRLQAILGYLKGHLADPELGLPTVSAHFGLSERYVQKLFAATGSTFSQTVLGGRLDQIAQCLRSPAYAGRTLTEIAFSWGFNDVSYFSRAFRARFGTSARGYRQEAHGDRAGRMRPN